MADNETDKSDRTEEASPRKREEAREQGRVALSQEFVAAMMLCAAAASLMLVGGSLGQSAGELASTAMASLPALGTIDWSVEQSANLVTESAYAVILPALLVLLPGLLIGLIAAYGQIGLRLTPTALALKPAKFNPVTNLAQLFSLKSSVRTLQSMAKLFLISAVVVWNGWRQALSMGPLAGGDLGPLLIGIGRALLSAATAGLIVIVVLALIDLFYQRWQFTRDLRMSKEEVKQEHRNAEGDPQVKAKMRQIQREMSRRRMMADVPKATVVITNPTHYAVALLYERDAQGQPRQGAPKVVAKGTDELARRIKAVAAEAGVVVYEDVPLARSLHAQVEIGEEIPEGLYAAVATVLNYVYRLQGARAGATA